MISGLFEAMRQQVDRLKDGPNYLLTSKSGHGPHLLPQLGKVARYNPEDHTAEVWLAEAGDSAPVKMPIEVSYQGQVPGTGAIESLYAGQLVRVNVGREGVYSTATIVGTFATPTDHPAPSHPAWIQANSKAGRLTIDPGANGEGNVHMVDKDSNEMTVRTANVSVEALGSESTVQAGPLVTYPELKTKEMANKFESLSEGILT